MRSLELLLEIGAGVGAHALDQPFALDDLEVLQPDRAGDRVAGIGVAVEELAALVDQRRGDAVADEQRRQRQVA